MIEIYFISIIFYMCVIFGAICVTAENIEENGWLEGKGAKKHSYNHFLMKLIAVSCVPIFRFFILIAFFVMSCATKEQVDEYLGKNK
jgi:hypothetical protein